MIHLRISLNATAQWAKKQSKLLAGVAAGLVLGGSAIAFAAIPDGAGIIHGCYRTSNGSLKVIDDASQTCASNETAITWNQQGPAGPQGPTGPEGPVGPQGPAGNGGGMLRSNTAGADFTGAVMVYWDLDGFDFTNTNFYKANLGNSSFLGATLSGISFEQANLTNVDLSGHDLSGANLKGANLTNADLDNTNIGPGKDLSEVFLSNTSLNGISLSGTILSGAGIDGQDLSNRDLSGILMLEVNGPVGYIINSNLAGSTLNGANLSCASLSNNTFQNAEMHDVILGMIISEDDDHNCGSGGINLNFNGADLTGGDFRGINLTGSTFVGATLTNTTWDNVTCPDGTNSNSHSNTCVGHLN